MIPEISELGLQSFFQTLAIIQTTVLSIILAIYSLSARFTAERFTTGIISEVQEGSSYRRIVLIFTASIFVDLVGLLSFQWVPSWAAWILVSLAGLGALWTFGSLFHYRDELLSTSEVPSVADTIRDAITVEEFRTQVRGSDTTIPFYNLFKAGRTSLSEGDKDASNQLISALCQSTTGLVEDLFEADEGLNDEEVRGLNQIVDEVEELALESLEQGYGGTGYILDSMKSVIEVSVEDNQASIARNGIASYAKISQKVIERDQDVSSAVDDWSDIMEAVAESGDENVLEIAIPGFGEVISTSIESADIWEGRGFSITRGLTSIFLDGWETIVAEHGSGISNNDRIEDSTEYLRYRFFENEFETLSMEMASRAADEDLPMAGSTVMRTDLLEGLGEVAEAAADVQNEYLAKRLAKMVVEFGFGFDDTEWTKQRIRTVLSDIAATNDTGRSAVEGALEELQTPFETDSDGEFVPFKSNIVLNLGIYTFEDTDEFIEAVEELEGEVSADGE